MYTQKQIEHLTAELRSRLGDNIIWKYEDRYGVMLSEFAQNKSDDVFERLVPIFPFQWDHKAAKKLPNVLKNELKDLARIGKKQKLLLTPKKKNSPAIVAFWWPWGHGGTYSLRLKVLEYNISVDEINEKQSGLFDRLFSWLS
ncbi:hypothetical protein [Thalassotalea sp. PP2-459]|uniref:hypothetical protein n=1 Tax=Thalassotalea sp. PP2-459 TaxID=1742724 RepID=UPI0009453F45|nr:hypothetical protein [Thalassotalea sp. PP2-459]OKY26589.1 hypothetical protein BI291_00900 [Thalassotalea sp. PP2-459]